jgi:hypothetical protein
MTRSLIGIGKPIFHRNASRGPEAAEKRPQFALQLGEYRRSSCLADCTPSAMMAMERTVYASPSHRFVGSRPGQDAPEQPPPVGCPVWLGPADCRSAACGGRLGTDNEMTMAPSCR